MLATQLERTEIVNRMLQDRGLDPSQSDPVKKRNEPPAREHPGDEPHTAEQDADQEDSQTLIVSRLSLRGSAAVRAPVPKQRSLHVVSQKNFSQNPAKPNER